jgi:pyrimidine deaminase RibD-like protein
MDMELLDDALKRVSQEMHARSGTNHAEAICLVRRDDLRAIIRAAAGVNKEPALKLKHVLDFVRGTNEEEVQSILQAIYERP